MSVHLQWNNSFPLIIFWMNHHITICSKIIRYILLSKMNTTEMGKAYNFQCAMKMWNKFSSTTTNPISCSLLNIIDLESHFIFHKISDLNFK